MPGDLTDGPHLHPRLAQRHQQQGQALMALAARLGARQHEDPVRQVGPGGPDLLPIDDPVAVFQARASAHGGQVRAGAGLGVALGPELSPLADGRQKACLLLGRAMHQQGGRQQRLADVPQAPGAARPGVLLVIRHLLRQRPAPPAVLARPAHGRPPALGQRLLPAAREARIEAGLARAVQALQGRKVTLQLSLQPGADLAANGVPICWLALRGRRGRCRRCARRKGCGCEVTESTATQPRSLFLRLRRRCGRPQALCHVL